MDFHTLSLQGLQLIYFSFSQLSPKVNEKAQSSQDSSSDSPPRDALWGMPEIIFLYFAPFHSSNVAFFFKKVTSAYHSTEHRTLAYCNFGYELCIY